MTASAAETLVECAVVDVRPELIASRSLRQQIELVGELLGAGFDARREVLEEWLERLGYAGAVERARLECVAALVSPIDRWHVAILRGLLLQPRRMRLHCQAAAPERPRLEWIAQQLRQRYPLRQVDLVDAP